MSNQITDIKKKENGVDPFSFTFSDLSVSSRELTLPDIKDAIQCILDGVFKIQAKRNIEEEGNRFNFACPYCGDSDKDVFKKRGNFYFKNSRFKCFNCGETKALYQFIKEFEEFCDLDDEELFLFKTFRSSFTSAKTSGFELFDKELINKYGIPLKELKELFGFIDAHDTPGDVFLRNRLQKVNDNYLYDKKFNNLIIVNKTKDDIVLGYQVRKIKEKGFFSYKISTMYNKLNRTINEEDKESLNKLNSISLIFNLFNINLNYPLTIFEGPFDSFLYGNSIALSGAFVSLPFEIEKMRFWFDKDETGTKKSIDKLKDGHYVFLWKKYLKDMGIYWPENKKLDLNDLIIYAKQNQIRLNSFDDYFSNEKIDLFYV